MLIIDRNYRISMFPRPILLSNRVNIYCNQFQKLLTLLYFFYMFCWSVWLFLACCHRKCYHLVPYSCAPIWGMVAAATASATTANATTSCLTGPWRYDMRHRCSCHRKCHHLVPDRGSSIWGIVAAATASATTSCPTVAFRYEASLQILKYDRKISSR